VRRLDLERVGAHGLRASGFGTLTGRYKEQSCAGALRRLEGLGLVKLPVRQPARGPEAEIVPGSRTDPEKEIVGTVRDMEKRRENRNKSSFGTKKVTDSGREK
jgi:hypothetical protein